MCKIWKVDRMYLFSTITEGLWSNLLVPPTTCGLQSPSQQLNSKLKFCSFSSVWKFTFLFLLRGSTGTCTQITSLYENLSHADSHSFLKIHLELRSVASWQYVLKLYQSFILTIKSSTRIVLNLAMNPGST